MGQPKKIKGHSSGARLPPPTPMQREQVQALAGFGMTQEEIAIVLGIGENQLKRDYPEDLRRGMVKADAAVLTNLYKIATGTTKSAATAAIFWTKVRRKWHEIQRVVHGFDPEQVGGFVRQLTALLRRELPEHCPHCKTKLDLPKRVAQQMRALSQKLAETLPPSQIVPIPAPGPEGAG